jgi:hypothetical protein
MSEAISGQSAIAAGSGNVSTTDWYDQYMADIAALGSQLAQGQTPLFTGPRVAGFNEDQLNAMAAMRANTGANAPWREFSEASGQLMDNSTGGLEAMRNMVSQYSGMINQNAAFDRPTFENTYMDIYNAPAEAMQNAADSIGQRNFQNTTLKNLNDNFAGTGQFGSGRHQILGADAAAQAQAQIEEAKATIGMQATQNAMGDYRNWAQHGLQSAQQGMQGANLMGDYASKMGQAATGMMNFGLANQRAALGDASLLGNIGQMQQDATQQNYNQAYQDFLTQRDDPWRRLQNWTSVMHGASIPGLQTQSPSPPVAPASYQNPWMSALQGYSGANQLTSTF